jgi:pilus assembly protein Flp/PilA
MLYSPREEGQGLLEYAMILVLVAAVVLLILVLMGPTIGNYYSNVLAQL